jgi:hypothetical protein
VAKVQAKLSVAVGTVQEGPLRSMWFNSAAAPKMEWACGWAEKMNQKIL